MTKTIEMIVGLKVPDATAITALQTLKKMGLLKIIDAKRADYYKFQIDDDARKFKDKISKADILVNANKHSFTFSIPKDKSIKLLVKNLNGGENSILSTLKLRLGFKNIKKAEKGTLWMLYIDGDRKESMRIAEKAALDLLVNEHCQDFTVL